MWLIGTGQTARRVSSNVEDGLGLHLSQLLQHNGGTSTAPDSHEAMCPPPPPSALCKLQGHAAFSQACLGPSSYEGSPQPDECLGEVMYTLEFMGFFCSWMILLCPALSLASLRLHQGLGFWNKLGQPMPWRGATDARSAVRPFGRPVRFATLCDHAVWKLAQSARGKTVGKRDHVAGG